MTEGRGLELSLLNEGAGWSIHMNDESETIVRSRDTAEPCATDWKRAWASARRIAREQSKKGQEEWHRPFPGERVKGKIGITAEADRSHGRTCFRERMGLA